MLSPPPRRERGSDLAHAHARSSHDATPSHTRLAPRSRSDPKKGGRKKAHEPKTIEEEADASLKAICPPGMDPNEAGRLLFSGAAANAMCEASGAMLETFPPTDPDEIAAERLMMGLAVQTLDAQIGEEWRDFIFSSKCAPRRAYRTSSASERPPLARPK